MAKRMAFHSLLHQWRYDTTRLMSRLMSRPCGGEGLVSVWVWVWVVVVVVCVWERRDRGPGRVKRQPIASASLVQAARLMLRVMPCPCARTKLLPARKAGRGQAHSPRQGVQHVRARLPCA